MTGAVLVTGIGVAAPNGLGVGDYWAATLRGDSGIGRLTRFDPAPYPATLAGQVPGFVPEQHLPGRLIPQTDHMTRLALTAADWALADCAADLDAIPELDRGVVTAATAGGFEFGQRELQNLWGKGSSHVSAYQSFAWFYAVNTGQISIRNNMRGPSGVFVADHAGGLDAIAQARRKCRRGAALMVTGGVDGSLCPWGWVSLLAGGGLATGSDAAHAYLPFDADAAGYVPGEGGAILVLETAQSAARRSAPRVYGEIAGYAATFDPAPGSGRGPALRRAAELALADARLAPAEIDVVFADAAGLPGPDLAEAEAISAVFGPRGVPVTAPKTMTGRLGAGGGPLDTVAALLAIRDGVIPPTVNVGRPADGIELDLVVGAPREARVDAALVLARGHGGFNTALVVRRA